MLRAAVFVAEHVFADSQPATRLQKLVNMTSTCMKTLGWSFIFCFVIMQLGFDGQILPMIHLSGLVKEGWIGNGPVF